MDSLPIYGYNHATSFFLTDSLDLLPALFFGGGQGAVPLTLRTHGSLTAVLLTEFTYDCIYLFF